MGLCFCLKSEACQILCKELVKPPRFSTEAQEAPDPATRAGLWRASERRAVAVPRAPGPTVEGKYLNEFDMEASAVLGDDLRQWSAHLEAFFVCTGNLPAAAKGEAVPRLAEPTFRWSRPFTKGRASTTFRGTLAQPWHILVARLQELRMLQEDPARGDVGPIKTAITQAVNGLPPFAKLFARKDPDSAEAINAFLGQSGEPEGAAGVSALEAQRAFSELRVAEAQQKKVGWQLIECEQRLEALKAKFQEATDTVQAKRQAVEVKTSSFRRTEASTAEVDLLDPTEKQEWEGATKVLDKLKAKIASCKATQVAQEADLDQTMADAVPGSAADAGPELESKLPGPLPTKGHSQGTSSQESSGAMDEDAAAGKRRLEELIGTANQKAAAQASKAARTTANLKPSQQSK